MVANPAARADKVGSSPFTFCGFFFLEVLSVFLEILKASGKTHQKL